MRICFNKECGEYESREPDNCGSVGIPSPISCIHWIRAEKSASTPEPQPTGNGEMVWPEVVKDLISRDAVGQKKYGTSLKTDNGRDALMDAYQECLDQCCYLKQAIMERDHD